MSTSDSVRLFRFHAKCFLRSDHNRTNDKARNRLSICEAAYSGNDVCLTVFLNMLKLFLKQYLPLYLLKLITNNIGYVQSLKLISCKSKYDEFLHSKYTHESIMCRSCGDVCLSVCIYPLWNYSTKFYSIWCRDRTSWSSGGPSRFVFKRGPVHSSARRPAVLEWLKNRFSHFSQKFNLHLKFLSDWVFSWNSRVPPGNWRDNTSN
jgi:hypothetical protein